MDNLQRIKLIEKNMYESDIKYNNNLINLEQYNILKSQGRRRIKELKKLIQKGEYY